MSTVVNFVIFGTDKDELNKSVFGKKATGGTIAFDSQRYCVRNCSFATLDNGNGVKVAICFCIFFVLSLKSL